MKNMSFWALLSLITVIVGAVLAPVPPVPALPQTYIDTTWNQPTGGTTWAAHTAAQLQGDLNSAHPGDVIVLDPGVPYIGNFTLPPKASSGIGSALKTVVTKVGRVLHLTSAPAAQWIYIESGALANLPVGVRVSPTQASYMARIVTPNSNPPITIAPGAKNYRLVGLEITTVSNQGGNPTGTPVVNPFTYFLIYPNVAQNGSTGPLPDSVTVDRCYLHGTPTQDVREGFNMNGTNFALIDSYISDIHQSLYDSQAVVAYYTPGPLKIVDNYLSATTEDIMLGGAGGYNNPFTPSDVEIRNNHLYKPMSWDAPGVTIPPHPQWVEKNNLELKSALRVLITGNTLENTWKSGQEGYSAVFTVRTSQSGNRAVVDDITFQQNTLKSVDAGVNTLEQDNDCSAAAGYPNCTNRGEAKRIKIYNNLILLSSNTDTYQHTWLLVDGGNSTDVGLTDFVAQHNTALMADNSQMWNFVFNLPQMPWDCSPPVGFSATHNVWILDNVIDRQPIGTCSFTGTTGLGWYMGDPQPVATRYYGNVMFVAGDHPATWPPHNDVTSTPFTFAPGTYQLTVPNWTDTSDGKIAGINWASAP